VHDFNNMLQLVLSSLDLMQGRLERGSTSELARPLRVASMSAERVVDLARRLLKRSPQYLRQRETVKVNEVLLGMVDLLGVALGDSIELTLRLDDLPLPILSETHELENAVLNLVINARDAMPNGGRLVIATSRVEIAPRVESGDPRPHARICIADTGCGMSRHQIERAFDAFYTTKPAGRGTGLGLSTIKHFVDRYGGQVQFESVLGRGTVVMLDLPCQADTVAAATRQT
jgi:signal transduction histidine kinase